MGGRQVGESIEQISSLLRRAQCISPVGVGGAIGNVLRGRRLTEAQGVALFEEADLGVLSLMATLVRLRLNGLKAYYNRNAHIEPTNGCLYSLSLIHISEPTRRPG